MIIVREVHKKEKCRESVWRERDFLVIDLSVAYPNVDPTQMPT